MIGKVGEKGLLASLGCLFAGGDTGYIIAQVIFLPAFNSLPSFVFGFIPGASFDKEEMGRNEDRRSDVETPLPLWKENSRPIPSSTKQQRFSRGENQRSLWLCAVLLIMRHITWAFGWFFLSSRHITAIGVLIFLHAWSYYQENDFLPSLNDGLVSHWFVWGATAVYMSGETGLLLYELPERCQKRNSYKNVIQQTKMSGSLQEINEKPHEYELSFDAYAHLRQTSTNFRKAIDKAAPELKMDLEDIKEDKEENVS